MSAAFVAAVREHWAAHDPDPQLDIPTDSRWALAHWCAAVGESHVLGAAKRGAWNAVRRHARDFDYDARHNVVMDAVVAVLEKLDRRAPVENWEAYGAGVAKNKIADAIVAREDERVASKAEAEHSESLSDAERDQWLQRSAGWVRRHLNESELVAAITWLGERGYRLRPPGEEIVRGVYYDKDTSADWVVEARRTKDALRKKKARLIKKPSAKLPSKQTISIGGRRS